MYVLFVVQEHKLGPRYFYTPIINEKGFTLYFSSFPLSPILLMSSLLLKPFKASLKEQGTFQGVSAGRRELRQCGLGLTK